jgi:hypothetical protein
MAWNDPSSWFGGDPGRTPVTGVGVVGTDPEHVAASYQQRAGAVLGGGDRATEMAQRQQMAALMQQYGQPTYAATEQAQRQAQQAGQATLGAAASRGGVAGAQLGALGALGAGAAQQYGMQAAAQVQAAESQQNALAQAQMAQMMRQQQMQAFGMDRADYDQMLQANRALLGQQTQIGSDYAAQEAERQRRMQGGAIGALGAGLSYLGQKGEE